MLVDIANRYAVDPNRVVVAGHQAGGAMALLTGFAERERVRGIVAIEAAMPRLVQIPQHHPLEPLFIATSRTPWNMGLDSVVDQGLQALEGQRIPTTVVPGFDESRYLNEAQWDQLARWVNTLDRL